MEPLVSIIIPVYNRAHLIGETLDSILEQTYNNWECIIVDDGSIDRTEEIILEYIKRDNRFLFYKRPREYKKGPSTCRNLGFNLSVGVYIHFMDSDDLYFSYSIKEYVERFKRGNFDLVVAPIKIVNLLSGETIKQNILEFDNLIPDFYKNKVIFYVSGPMWKRKFLLSQIQLFDDEITRLDDWDFNIRMLLQKPLIEFIKIPLVKYRRHANSLNTEVSKLNSDEIESHINAKNKIRTLIINQYPSLKIDFENDFQEFYLFIFKKSLLNKHSFRRKYFLWLLNSYWQSKEVKKTIFLIASYFSFEVFGFGYFFLKRI